MGYVGVMIGLASPAIAGILMMEFYEAMAARTQFATMPPSPIWLVAGLAAASVIGWVMVLVGREHYPVA